MISFVRRGGGRVPNGKQTAAEADATPAADRVPLKVKIGYGAGGISDYFLSKLAGVLMMGMSGLIPWLVGYHAADRAPTAAQLLSMKWILIAAQGGLVLIALLFILLYPLTRERALETRRILDARKRAC